MKYWFRWASALISTEFYNSFYFCIIHFGKGNNSAPPWRRQVLSFGFVASISQAEDGPFSVTHRTTVKPHLSLQVEIVTGSKRTQLQAAHTKNKGRSSMWHLLSVLPLFADDMKIPDCGKSVRMLIIFHHIISKYTPFHFSPRPDYIWNCGFL